jgi:hypothetical protein
VLEGDPAENIIAHDHSEKVNMVVMAAKDTVRCAAFSCGPSLRTFWAKKNRCGPQYTPMAARRLCFEIFSVLSICPPGCDDSWHRLMRLPLPLKSGCSRCTRCAVSRPQMLPLRHCGPDYPTPRISVPDSYRVPSGTDRHAAQAVVIFYYPWEVFGARRGVTESATGGGRCPAPALWYYGGIGGGREAGDTQQNRRFV